MGTMIINGTISTLLNSPVAHFFFCNGNTWNDSYLILNRGLRYESEMILAVE